MAPSAAQHGGKGRFVSSTAAFASPLLNVILVLRSAPGRSLRACPGAAPRCAANPGPIGAAPTRNGGIVPSVGPGLAAQHGMLRSTRDDMLCGETELDLMDLSKIPAGRNPPKDVHAVIEIPFG